MKLKIAWKPSFQYEDYVNLSKLINIPFPLKLSENHR